MKLEEITNRIYAEGVEKGQQQAAEIISKAQAEAAAIRSNAEKDAEEIVTKARQKADELDKNTRSELKMYAAQSVQALKTEITNLLCGEIVNANITAATADAKFMQGLITKMAEEMAKQGEVTIEAKDAEALKKYFAANAKGLLDKGVKITSVKGMKTDFQVAPAKGGYKLAFSDAELEAYFKAYLREDLIKWLF